MNTQLRTTLPKLVPALGRLHGPVVMPVRAYETQKTQKKPTQPLAKNQDPESPTQQRIKQDYERPDDIVGGKFWSGDVGGKEGLKTESSVELFDDELERGGIERQAAEGRKVERTGK